MKNTSNKNVDKTEKQLESGETSNPNKKTLLEIHGFTLGHVVGTGTYATVKVAWSNTQKCNVAVKIVSKGIAPADYLKKFLPREIEVVRILHHPNIIRFFQAIESTHRVYIIMEYADNGSLLDIIRRDTYIDEHRAKKWFKQLIEGVDYCHRNKVVHRDIKCENMLMDINYNLKLSDFGFARSVLRSTNGLYALSETFCGSYAYASPEILKGIPYQAPLADIWSCGVVLYAMLFGRLPFDDSNFSKLLRQVSNKITYPKEPQVSAQSKIVINKILVAVKERVTIDTLRREPWFISGRHASTTVDDSTKKTEKPTLVKADQSNVKEVVTVKNTESAEKKDPGNKT
ncbi:uncharacterized protein CBL_08114 [Carabus blaptoides fortunei]